MLQDKTIILGVCGGIAAYKAAALCSKLAQAGADVYVIMTESATKFIAPLTFQTLSRNPVMIDTFDEKDTSVVSHINLADKADLMLIAPATANMIAKMAIGLGDDMLSTTMLAATATVMVAPAMNVHMYEHPAVQENMSTLSKRGVIFVEQGSGQLACGYVGKGRLAEPEDIVAEVRRFFAEKTLLQGKRVLVTAGGTVERIDPVRYITNDSSGKMGYAVAEAARRLGAEVTLVTGPTALEASAGVQVVPVLSAEDMLKEVQNRYKDLDIVIKAAAVADYRPLVQSKSKMKKADKTLTLELVKNPDILETLGKNKTHQFLIGFAAETDSLDEYAMDKLVRKNCDLLVGNDVSVEGAGFGSETNVVRIYDKQGLVESLPLLRKEEVALHLLRLIAARMDEKEGEV
ncbi:bifunctional phosphopantothenoylcysteine decarboxylase/phosphopantothenate--cysteine ligase CoaBC [Paenibacillus larvae]|uniref:bifunctional phosphopantothenoylcysteine decarboxylase/phosphopantothenate--cysteine ligase CoaBC n=1 Tax=Paenibacillus larvae TaxID=1464 RepID=UPI00293CE95D|nr:bifunctional phosphopantothenoylcysteine decarboxylase/phosphopantothenate--cysteine ligase CoaBC [Paenibacillus larvae]MDV3433060.1 bifunctional phosphopantothenoylcysteine decarboxylase/phosphopantothenate--cysteine ligase CoaBC [Paenibacillus larvae]MDV3447948.1 bifunctional phosphopantothenoylcysteine decarboxylase/phosphopantothenate--cysteine ligase CoaBC [Paenibacillus larvae]MDV3486230.1 bifunctional phosphopantothenoylcysteine decarboxylase/phosphopantothenate--cysteine ligase CoaBC 